VQCLKLFPFFGSVYFAAKMPAAIGLSETKYIQKINPKGNPNLNP